MALVEPEYNGKCVLRGARPTQSFRVLSVLVDGYCSESIEPRDECRMAVAASECSLAALGRVTAGRRHTTVDHRLLLEDRAFLFFRCVPCNTRAG